MNLQKLDQNDGSQMSKTRFLKRSLWIFFESPNGRGPAIYHLGTFSLILGSLVISILHTMKEFDEDQDFQTFALMYELVLLILFLTEYALRLWACGYVSRYKGFWGHIRFITTLYMVIDIIVIAATSLTFVLHLSSKFTVLRATTFLQILRILRIDRKRGDLRLITAVLREHSKELMTCYFIGFIILFAGSYVVYVSEKYSNIEDGILNMADGLYWAAITVTSVGYGDFSPQSWPGKYLAAVFALVGCAFFSLPAGILGSGFALHVNKRKKEKQVQKIRQPAAILIQSCWRNYMIRKPCLNEAWYAILPQIKVQYHHKPVLNPVQSGGLEGLMRTEFYKSNLNGEDDLGFDNITFNPSIPSSEVADGDDIILPGLKSTLKGNFSKLTGHHHLDRSNSILTRKDLVQKRRSSSAVSESKSNNPLTSLRTKLSKFSLAKQVNGFKSDINSNPFEVLPKYRGAIRFYIHCKYRISLRKFKYVRQPYVSVQDLLEAANQKHLELIYNIKDMKEEIKYLHKRMEKMEKIYEDGDHQRKQWLFQSKIDTQPKIEVAEMNGDMDFLQVLDSIHE